MQSANRGARMLSSSTLRTSIIDNAKKFFQKGNKVEEVANEVDKKTGEVLAEGIREGEMIGERQRVHQNYKGYKNLVDKGKKVETEQNRPDDAE